MRLLKSSLLIICFILLRLTLAEGKSPESCVGGLCLDKPSFNEAWLVARHGKGFMHGIRLEGGKYLDKTHCYYVADQDIWAEFTADYHDQTQKAKEIVQIFLSKEPLCEKTYLPKTAFKRLVTTKDIQIGSLEADVIRAYGDPTRVDDSIEREKANPSYMNSKLASKFGPKVLVYLAGEDNLLLASFYIKSGRVYSIELSVSE